jgi:hypothetical protein
MPWHWLDPFAHLASAAGKVVADGWTTAMLGVWNCGLWLLTHVLGIVDAFTTPDLSAAGPGAQVYRYTFWIGGSLALTMGMLQLGVTAVRRDGRSLARVLLGTGQFVMVWAAWLAYAVMVLAACGGLTRALMRALLDVEVWAAWQPWEGFSTDDITDGTVATVLGFLGVFLVFAAIGHLLVMLTRAAALLVLTATAPISAAGLLSDAGRAWFWKSLRWFHAAAFTPVLMVLVLGIGVQLTQGVTGDGTDRLDKAVATAVPGVVLICIGCFAPLVLFKLLAFVEPGTSSGSAMRTGLAAQGGVGGLLGGLAGGAGGKGDATSGAASSTDEHGRSQAESSGEEATSSRFAQASRLGGAAGQFGGAVGAGLGMVASVGAKGAAVGADLTAGMGVGQPSYIPDFASARRSGGSNGNGGGGTGRGGPSDDDNPDVNGSGDSTGSDATGGGQVGSPFDLPATGTDATAGTGAGGASAGAPGPTPAPGGGGGGGAGAAGAGGAAAGGAGAAAAVPVIPV